MPHTPIVRRARTTPSHRPSERPMYTLCLFSVVVMACVMAPGVAQATPPVADARERSMPRLIPVWSTPGFASPESVALSADRRFLYVSNVDGAGDARDGNGHVSRVSLDGRVLQSRWATGLDAPKGLALRGQRLFVSDIAQLVELDARNGRLIARHDVDGAKFLNDVAIAPKRTTIAGGVLVSDSATSRIHLWHEGRMTVWLEDALLRSINGLLPEHDRLIVTTMQGRLLAVDWKTRAITVLNEGLGNSDGVVALGGGDYLVGEWPGRLFHVAGDKIETLLDSRDEKHYINDFILIDAPKGKGRLLVVPQWEPGAVVSYRLDR